MKHGIGRKLLSVVLAVMMLVSLLPTAAFAEELNNSAENIVVNDVKDADEAGNVAELTDEDPVDVVDTYADEGEGEVAPQAAVSGEVSTAAELTAALVDSTISTITLMADISKDVTVAEGRIVTIDLNGNKLTGYIRNSGNLTINDTSVGGTGEITGNSFTINEGSYNSLYTGSVVAAASGAKLTINGGTLAGKWAVSTMVRDNTASFDVTVNGGTIDGNVGPTALGAYAPAMNLTVTNGTFTSNCYQINADNKSTVVISGGEFNCNGYNSNSPRGLNLDRGSTATISGGTFKNGWTLDGGSAVNTSTDTERNTSVEITGGNFNGAHVNVCTDDTLTITGGNFDSSSVISLAWPWSYEVSSVGNANISGGTFAGTINATRGAQLAITNGDFSNATINAGGTNKGATVKGNLAISGGTFDASKITVDTTTGATASVSGGTFANASAIKDYLAEDVELDANGNVVAKAPAALTLDDFIKAVVDADYDYDGKGVTVKWSPVSGCFDKRGADGHTCTVGNVAATGNTPLKVNSDLAQFSMLTGVSNVTIKNVNFVYEAADFTICANSGWKGSFTAENVKTAQLYLQNSGNTTVENCSFDNVVFTSFDNTGSTTIANCQFKNIYNAYAIKDLGGSSVSVTGSTFENCGGGVMLNSNKARSASATVTITGNTFNKVDVADTAAEDKVGTRGLIQLAKGGDYSDTTFSFTGNSATNCGPVLRQLNETAITKIEEQKTVLKALGTLYTADSKKPAVAATIGDVEYATLDDAIKAVKNGETIVVNAGEYTLTDSQTVYVGKAFTITAAEGADVSFDMTNAVTLGSAKVTFNNVTFNYKSNEDYRGLQHANTLVYNNCTINGMVFLYAENETFNNCTFNQTVAGAYNVWTYGAKNVAFNGCTFNCVGRCVLVYTEDKNANTALTVKDTEFNASEPAEGKAAIEIDTRLMTNGGATITVDDKTTATGFDNGSNSGNPLWNDKGQTADTNKNTTVIVAGETVFAPMVPVASIGDKNYASLAEAIAAAKDGDTVTLLADATEDVVIDKNITLDLGGKTLTNTNAGKATVTIAKGATATVKNGTVKGGDSYYDIQNNGIATFEGITATGNNVASLVDNFGTLTITSGTYTGGLDTVKNEPGAKLTINGGDFTLTKGTKAGFTAVVFNYGDLTITGGTFTQSDKSAPYGQAQVIHTDKSGSAAPSTKIEGGTFKNLCTSGAAGKTAWTVRQTNAAAGATKVSGGTFNKTVSESYWADGCGVYPTASGEYTAMPADKVARLGSYNYYTTLEEAIAAVGTGVSTSTIVYLLKNVTIDTQLVIDNSKAITLNLNGFTLTSTYKMGASGADRYALVNKTALTMKNGTFEVDQARAIGAYGQLMLNGVKVTQTLTGGHACVAFCANDTKYWITDSTIDGAYAVCSFADNATITIKNSKLIGTGNTLYHNGTNYGLKLTVADTTITSTGSCGVYISGSTSAQSNAANQNGVGGHQQATFTGCTITGATNGVEVKYTDLTLDGCAVSTTATEASYKQDNNGPAGSGFAVVSTDNAVNSATPKPEGTIKITGEGKYTGPVGLGALASVKETYKDFTDNTIQVSGGTFDSAVLPEYCADGFVPTKNEDGTYGVREANYVAQVGEAKYETLQAAIDAAKSGATVTMLADTRENVTISTKLTLDLNGFTLNGGTVAGKPALTVTARVTVKDSSADQNGTIMREDTADNSGVSSHYVIDIQGDGWLTFEGGNVKNNSGTADYSKGASLVRVGDDSFAKYPGLNIKGGTFTQDNFIAIKVDRGDLFLNGGTITSANSYAIEDWHRATINSGTVNGNVAAWTYSGGANSSLTIKGGTINGDVKSVNYGNSVDRTAKVSISGGTVNGKLGTYDYDTTTKKLNDLDNPALATIAVSGGTFSEDPTKYVVAGSAATKNSDGTFGVAKQVIAKIGDTEYYDMDEAFHAVTEGQTITLMCDYVTSKVQNSGYDSFTIDLNDHTWTFTGTDVDEAAFEINYADVTLTVKNGKVVSNSMVGLIPTAMSGSITYNKSGLVFENVEMNANGHSGIETNGGNSDVTVTLKDSVLNVPNGYGIYFPSSGTLTIDNSVINAKTMGVQVCAGSLNITGDKTAITVTGDGVTKTENDGAIEDGAAISIVNRTGYKGLVNVTVDNGTFKANGTNAAIKAYDWANNAESDFTANDKVAVSGGSFSSAVPEGLCAEGYVPTGADANGNYTVRESAYVAEYNGTQYTSLQGAIDDASQKNGGQAVVTLLDNLTITGTVNFANVKAASVLLDLGGYTLTGEGCRALQINKGNLYLKNGTVTSTGIVNSSSVIRIGSNEAQYSGAAPMLYMQKDAKVLAPDSYGVTIFGSATVSEKLKVTSNAVIEATGPSPAISGNGDKAYHVDGKGTEILVAGTAVVSATNNYAIYHPDNGTLNIQGGTVSGKGGIQMCSGTLNISGSAKIEALGKADHETGAAGPIYDIAAISVVNRNYPGGLPTVTIKGTPTVTAKGEVIHAYTWSSGAESEWAEAGDNINVSGGTYSKTFNEAYLAADCTLVENENGTYTVEQKPVAEYNGTQYTSLSQAILDANKAGGTVKLLENVKLTSDLAIGGSALVTLDLGKKTLTLDGAQIFTKGTANTIITNGTIERIDTPTANNSGDFAIQINSGNMMTIGTGLSSNVTINAPYGIYVIGGKLNARYTTINTEGWSIAVNDSATKAGEVEIGLNATTTITSQNGNCIGTAVNSKPNVIIHKGTLTSNGTAWDAGVIYWASEGTLTIEGGTFTASSAEGSTAAAVYQKNGTVKISGATTKLLGNNALVVQAGDGSTGTMVTELSAGTYSTKPDEAWVVEGKEIHETADKFYKVEGPYLVEVTFDDGTVTKYDSWFNAFASSSAQYKNATVKLLENIETSTVVKTFATVTIDFNGHTLTVVQPENTAETAAITLLASSARGTAHVTLKDSSEAANGGMKTTNVYGVTVKGSNTTLTVENGNYNCDTSVVQVEKPVSGVATAYIEGGTFQTEDADKSYLLNCIDDAFKDGTAVMEVTGGTFYGFDPSANPEGEGTTYVKTGYVSTDNGDGTYTVVKNENVVAVIGTKEYTDLSVALKDATENGATVLLVANVDAKKDLVQVRAGVTLDLNGYSITNVDLLRVTGQIIDTSDANARGIVSAEDYVITPLNDYTPVYNSAKGGYSFFDLWVRAAWESKTSTGVFALGRNRSAQDAIECAAAKELMKADLSRVDAVITFSWTNDQGTVVTQTFTYLDAKTLGYLKIENGGVLTVAVSGLENINSTVTMQAKFVFYKADKNQNGTAELFTLYSAPVTVK